MENPGLMKNYSTENKTAIVLNPLHPGLLLLVLLLLGVVLLELLLTIFVCTICMALFPRRSVSHMRPILTISLLLLLSESYLTNSNDSLQWQ